MESKQPQIKEKINKKGKKLGLIITSIFVLIALITGCVFAVLKYKSDDNNQEPQTACLILFKVDNNIYTFSIIDIGEKVSKPTIDPAKENYPFMGWYNGETEWNFDTDIANKNITLNAKFGFYYTVTFKIGNEIFETKKVENGKKVSIPLYEKSGYTVKWYNGETEWNFENEVTSDLTLTLKTEAIEYTATFKADGEVVDTRTFTVEDTVIANIPEVPSKSGYTGAWESSTIKAENIVINANYSLIEYTATFKADGVVVGTRPFTVEDTVIANIPQVPSKAGYTGAWESYTIKAENIVVNAVYTAIEYTATFKADGVVVGTRPFTVEDTVIANIPQVINKAGFNASWEPFTIKAENLTINAIYMPITYTATFKADEVTIATRQFTILDTIIADIPEVPDKAGYGGEWESYSIKAQNIIINAVYTKLEYDKDGFKIIWNKKDLIDYASNTDNYLINARLYADITLGNVEWTPMGNNENPYQAIFDGNSYKIKEFKITTTKDYNAFIGYANGSVIKNLGLEDFEIIGKSYVGGLIGYAEKTEIVNCYTTGNISGTNYVGGLIGYAEDLEKTKCYVTGNVSGSNYIGGLIGYINNGKSIIECYTTGCVSSISSNNIISYTAGLIGYVSSCQSIIECYTTGDVSAKVSVKGKKISPTSYVGGLIGYIKNCDTIIECYSISNVSSNVYSQLTDTLHYGCSTIYIGGLIGQVEKITFQNCYSTGNLLANARTTSYISSEYSVQGGVYDSYAYIYAGGLIGYDSEIILSNCYSLGEISANLDSGEDYAYIGGLLGSDNNSTITNSYATGIVSVVNTSGSYDKAKFSIGGLIGQVKNGNIMNCFATNNLSIKSYNESTNCLGGLIGNDDSSIITNSYATGNISATGGSESTNYVGGFVGQVNKTTISNCYATGSAGAYSGYPDIIYVGGLIGFIIDATITNCYASGYVEAATAYAYTDPIAGGLIGCATGGRLTNCYATGNVLSKLESNTGSIHAGGLIGINPSNLTITNCYRYNEQNITTEGKYSYGYSPSKTVCNLGTNADMETIWAFILENWNSDVWELYSDKNPTLK